MIVANERIALGDEWQSVDLGSWELLEWRAVSSWFTSRKWVECGIVVVVVVLVVVEASKFGYERVWNGA